MEKKTKLQFGPEEIKKLVRFEMDPLLFSADSDIDVYEDVTFVGEYKPDYRDLVAACRKMIELHVDYSTLSEWYLFVTEENYCENFKYAWMYYSVENGYLWPGNEDDLFCAIKDALDDICFICEGYSPEEIETELKDAIQIAEKYEINKGRDPVDWELTDLQKERILRYFWANTNKVTKSRKELLRRIVEEGCEKGSELAMEIKGYSCYGGDQLYECDWEESRKWITKLFEKNGNPMYANTLGYIYYYGRCNGGIPEYEKAFQYFSVGAAHGILESMYKQADMFLHGKGCIKSPQTSDFIIEKLYDECELRFLQGEDAKFADIALRRAAAFLREERYKDALSFYLQADYAIKKRLKKSDFFGDKKVQENITKAIQEVKSKLPADFFKDEIVTEHPFWLFNLVDMRYNTKVEIESLGENRYKIRLDRGKKDHPAKALIVAEELERVTLTRVLETEFITDEPIQYFCKDKTNMYVSDIDCNSTEGITFYNSDVKILAIKNAKFILKKSDFDHDVVMKKQK